MNAEEPWFRGSPNSPCFKTAHPRFVAAADFGQLRVRLYGRASGTAALPRDLLHRHRLRPQHDRAHEEAGRGEVQPKERIRARLAGACLRRMLQAVLTQHMILSNPRS
eukprot:3294701-Pleurochrysis_carterae.AAC.5